MPTLKFSNTVLGADSSTVQKAWFSEHWQVADEALPYFPFLSSVFCRYEPSKNAQPFNRLGEARWIGGVIREEIVVSEPGKIQYTVTNGPVQHFLATVEFKSEDRCGTLHATKVSWHVSFEMSITLFNSIGTRFLEIIIPRFLDQFKYKFESLYLPGGTTPANDFEELFGVVNDTRRLNKSINAQPYVLWGFAIMANKFESLDELRKYVKQTLVNPFPRMRSTLAVPQKKSWFPPRRQYTVIDAAEVDMDYHIVRLEQPDTDCWTLDELAKKTEQMNNEIVWDGNKPPWKMFTVDCVLHKGKKRSCLVFAFDHEIGDGAVLVSMLFNHLASPLGKPNSPAANVAPAGRFIKAEQNRYALLPQQLWFAMKDTVLAAFGKHLPVDCDHSLKMVRLSKPTPRGIFLWSDDLDLSKLKEIKNQYPGSSVTHVLLAITTIATRKYFEQTGELDIIRKGITCQVPMNCRGRRNDPLVGRDFSNQIATYAIQLPLSSSPEEVIPEVIKGLSLHTYSLSGVVSRWLSGVTSSSLPLKTMWNLYMDMLGNVTMQVTGLRVPVESAIEIMGNEVVDLRFAAMGAMPMYGGWLTYRGRVGFSLSADGQIGDNPDLLLKQVYPAFQELYRASVDHEARGDDG